MSGIAGVIRFDGGPAEPWVMEAMTRSLAHRGPDDLRFWSSGSVALGHCMLRVTPESLEEMQPLVSEGEALVLVMDGRLDNWEELRAELSALGVRLRDRSDAELVLKAYQTWGSACLDRLDGDFALVIWDGGRREVFCARDRMGHKPLHYHWDGRCLAFASELHAILALPWVEATLNEGIVAEYLAVDLCSLDETLWQGIFRLPPAHKMIVDGKGPTIEKYWTPDLGARLRYKREEDYVEHYRALLSDVVRRQSRARDSLALEVSGGLDSSAVFAVAETLWRQGKLLAPEIDAYTLRFEGGAAGRDLKYARAVGAHFGRAITEVAPTYRSLDWYRDWVFRYRDLPCAPHGTMQLGIGERALRDGSRVILGGVGGDQWLTGDHTYLAGSLAAGRWGEFLECLSRDARRDGLRKSLALAARYGVVPLLPLSVRRSARWALAHVRSGGDDNASWLSRALAETLANRRSRRSPVGPDRHQAFHRRKLRFLLNGEHVLAHEAMDRLVARLGMERRSPLDNARIAQFGFSVPQQWLLRDGWNRYIHRKALSGLLPGAVTWRQDKAEFSVVFEWQRAELCETVNRGPYPSLQAWISWERMVWLCAGGRPEKSRHLMVLWRLIACDTVRQTGGALPKFKPATSGV